MPKGRHLKPDFFTDKNIVGMSPLARLLYQGLWCYAYDCGHLDDEPIELKMRILPADNCNVDDLLDELAWHNRILRKGGVLELPKLAEHQKPDKRYMTLCDDCKALEAGPDPDDRKRWGLHKRWHTDRSIVKDGCEFCEAEHVEATTSEPSQGPQSHSDHYEPTTGPLRDHVVDGDGDGDGDGDKPAPKKRGTAIPPNWQPTDAHRAIADEERVDFAREVKKFRDNAAAKALTYIDWNAAFRNWLRSPYAPKLADTADPATWMRRRP